jgi:hypothetical protein
MFVNSYVLIRLRLLYKSVQWQHRASTQKGNKNNSPEQTLSAYCMCSGWFLRQSMNSLMIRLRLLYKYVQWQHRASTQNGNKNKSPEQTLTSSAYCMCSGWFLRQSMNSLGSSSRWQILYTATNRGNLQHTNTTYRNKK